MNQLTSRNNRLKFETSREDYRGIYRTYLKWMKASKPEDVNMEPVGFRITRILTDWLCLKTSRALDRLCPEIFPGHCAERWTTRIKLKKQVSLMWSVILIILLYMASTVIEKPSYRRRRWGCWTKNSAASQNFRPHSTQQSSAAGSVWILVEFASGTRKEGRKEGRIGELG